MPKEEKPADMDLSPLFADEEEAEREEKKESAESAQQAGGEKNTED